MTRNDAPSNGLEWLPSNKGDKTSKCFAKRRLQVLSPKFSAPAVPNLHRNRGLGKENAGVSPSSVRSGLRQEHLLLPLLSLLVPIL
jgi:hypothetical protein